MKTEVLYTWHNIPDEIYPNKKKEIVQIDIMKGENNKRELKLRYLIYYPRLD
jgi:hypothetical protein